MSKLLLIPLETARRLRVQLPGSPAEWQQMQCPSCPRMCWVHVNAVRRIQGGEASAQCILCAKDQTISEAFRRMLRADHE